MLKQETPLKPGQAKREMNVKQVEKQNQLFKLTKVVKNYVSQKCF